MNEIPSKTRNFHCKDCNKAYFRNSHLIRHQRYECGKAPQFSCDFCGKSYKQNTNRIIHMAKEHNYKAQNVLMKVGSSGDEAIS